VPKLMSEWSEPRAFLEYTANARALPSSVCLLLSGPLKFCRQLLQRLREHPGPFMFAIDHPFETFRRHLNWRNQREIVALCQTENFQYAVVNHSDFGGATNASHIVIFRGLAAMGFHPPPCMPRVLKHLLNSATPGRFVEIEEPASLQGSAARAPLVINGLLRREGLLDVHHPRRLVACPSVFAKSGWVSRRLSRGELLRAFDVPVAMDDLFSWTANSDVTLPCGIPHTISPLIVTSIFRSLWDNSGGGEDSVASYDEKHSGVRAVNTPNSPQKTKVHDDESLDDESLTTNDDDDIELGMKRDENGGEGVTSIRPMEVSLSATRESDNGFPLSDFVQGAHTPCSKTHPHPILFEFSHIPELATPQDSSALSLKKQKCNDTPTVRSSIRSVSSSRERLDRIKREHDLVG